MLQTVLAINAAIFLVEFGAGLLAHSTALLADSLDMLGDALVYAFSLYVLGRGSRWQAGAALLKGIVMAALRARRGRRGTRESASRGGQRRT